MKTRCLLKMTLLLILLATGFPMYGQYKLIALDDSIGVEIDASEQTRYRLFPGIEQFQSAWITMLPNGKYRLHYAYRTSSGLRTRTIPISAEALDLTRQHIAFSRKYQNARRHQPSEPATEAQIIYLLGLKYAAQTRYDLTIRLWDDLIADYPANPIADECQQVRNTVERLNRTKTALFVPEAFFDQSGRTDLMIFSGYHGLWQGIATPIALKAKSPQAFAAGLLLGAPISLLATHHLTKEANISQARATMIALGGHLGTWQGIGWALYADRKGNEIVGIGQLAGLAGIGMAALLTSRVEFSTGHASLTSSALPWGAWFSAVAATVLDHSGDEGLRDMLIGSNALVLGMGIAAKDVQMSKARVRIINLAGVVGTFLGFGIDLLVEIEDASASMAIAGLGSVVGLFAGVELTQNFDRNRNLELSSSDPKNSAYQDQAAQLSRKITTRLSLLPHPNRNGRWVPCARLQLNL